MGCSSFTSRSNIRCNQNPHAAGGQVQQGNGPGPPIDATATDATDGNQFRLTGTDWHFNLSTKYGFTLGTFGC